jgi:hypothetical protein
MVPLPNEEHLASKVDKVGIITEHRIELFICSLPKYIPRSHDIVRHMKELIKVVVGRHVQSTVTVTVTHNKLIFQSGYINLIDRPNKRETSQPAQGNRQTGFTKRPESNPMNNRVGVNLLRLSYLKLCLLRVRVRNWTTGVLCIRYLILHTIKRKVKGILDNT